MSVALVLEAMTQVEWEGFLRTNPRVGTVVSGVTARQVLDKFRLRQAIEVEAARLAAGPRPSASAAERPVRLPAEGGQGRPRCGDGGGHQLVLSGCAWAGESHRKQFAVFASGFGPLISPTPVSGGQPARP